MIFTNLPLCSKVLPYYGHTHTCVLLLIGLWKKSNEFWIKNIDILIRIILKNNKMKLSISSIYDISYNYALFDWIIDTELNHDLETLAKAVEKIGDSKLLSLAPSEWKITQHNLNSFIILLKGSRNVDLSPIQVDLSHECLQREEIMPAIVKISEADKLPTINLTLKHNEMVFPHIKQYRKILEETVVGLSKVTINMAMVKILKQSKILPNEVLQTSVESISLDWNINKRKNGLSVVESTKFLFSVFPNIQEFEIGGALISKDRWYEVMDQITLNSTGNLKSLKYRCDQNRINNVRS